MSKIKIILIISIAVLAGIILFGANVFAQPAPLVVQFEYSPLFNEANFLPGDTVTRSAIVTNNTAQTQKIGTQAVNVNNPYHLGYRLGDVMHLQITQGINTLYNGTLSQFFDAGEKYLSDLANGATITYNYSITFNSGAGDDYQGLGLGFDINVGFFGQESISKEVPPGVGGGGGGSYTAGLIISGEAIITIGSDFVTITWDTNLDSTSRVIYSPSPAPVFNINNPPNYNYTYSTIEIDNVTKVLHHSVTISGLTPSTVYFFRCVSHASPDTLSPEYSFTTLGAGAAIENTQQELNPTGEVLGEATIRTGLPNTGGDLFQRIGRRLGVSQKDSDGLEMVSLVAGISVIMMIALILIRKRMERGQE